MIVVKIGDTKGNKTKMVSWPKQRLVEDGIQRMLFVQQTSRMIGAFLQELKEQWKEAKKCQKE